jgi:hypothetical protein
MVKSCFAARLEVAVRISASQVRIGNENGAQRAAIATIAEL